MLRGSRVVIGSPRQERPDPPSMGVAEKVRVGRPRGAAPPCRLAMDESTEGMAQSGGVYGLCFWGAGDEKAGEVGWGWGGDGLDGMEVTAVAWRNARTAFLPLIGEPPGEVI